MKLKQSDGETDLKATDSKLVHTLTIANFCASEVQTFAQESASFLKLDAEEMKVLTDFKGVLAFLAGDQKKDAKFDQISKSPQNLMNFLSEINTKTKLILEKPKFKSSLINLTLPRKSLPEGLNPDSYSLYQLLEMSRKIFDELPPLVTSVAPTLVDIGFPTRIEITEHFYLFEFDYPTGTQMATAFYAYMSTSSKSTPSNFLNVEGRLVQAPLSGEFLLSFCIFFDKIPPSTKLFSLLTDEESEDLTIAEMKEKMTVFNCTKALGVDVSTFRVSSPAATPSITPASGILRELKDSELKFPEEGKFANSTATLSWGNTIQGRRMAYTFYVKLGNMVELQGCAIRFTESVMRSRRLGELLRKFWQFFNYPTSLSEAAKKLIESNPLEPSGSATMFTSSLIRGSEYAKLFEAVKLGREKITLLPLEKGHSPGFKT